MKHCIEIIERIVAEDRNDRRAILQLGYNLGRLSEITRLGREPFWDGWKDAVADWDRERLESLATGLHAYLMVEPATPPDATFDPPRRDAP
jgi:hypothetical protein